MASKRFARWRDPASLGAKLVLILTAAGLVGALGITLLLAAVITPSFNHLEGQAVHAHIERTEAVLGEYGSKVESAVRDYGDWNASYDYMAQPTRAFEQESFSPLAMSNLGVQGMAYLARDGRVVIARWLGGGDAGRAALLAALARIDPARALHGTNSGHFYLRVGGEVAAVGVAQVRRSDGTGTPRGLVVMARVLTSAQVAELLQLNARVEPAAGNVVEIATPSRALAEITVPVAGINGAPVASVRFGARRDVSLLGRRMLLLAVAGSTVLLLIVLVVLRRMIAQLVLKPLGRVEAHMQRVRASGAMTPLDEDGPENRRRDEIGALGRAFNAMLRQLGDLREQIEVQSFALGRSESAVAVMHNVRNALNPVSTILSQGIAQAPPVDRAMLDRAIAELARDDVPAGRRAKLVAFVTAGVDAWSTSREAMKSELNVGREAMAHVLEIIGQQQKKAHERPPLEPCDVTEIVARNATIARYSQHASIAFSFPNASHPVLANRVILSQVIGNLFGNAAEAIAATGRGSGIIAVTVTEEGGEVVVAIRDDGEGFDAATGQTLFQRGFSTRQHKSGGLGLHWCANSMTAMDGSLRLESAGKGQGAVALLTLRAAEAVRAAA